MTDEQIQEIALATGFTLKEQPDGSKRLNPYVFEFAKALLATTTAHRTAPLDILSDFSNFHKLALPEDQAIYQAMANYFKNEEQEYLDVVDQIIKEISELPDRTSPDDWPEAMLVTTMELEEILERNLLGRVKDSVDMEFPVGARVEKHTGDYQLAGVVVGHAQTTKGKRRYVVEHTPGFLHIYSAENLRAI